MAETVVMVVFAVLLFILQYQEQKEIIIEISNKKARKISAVLLAIVLVLVFWPATLDNQIKLSVFCGMIMASGLVKEGLGKTRLIKLGFLEAHYEKFQGFEISQTDAGLSYVTLYRGKKNNSTSFFSEVDETTITDFLMDKGIPKVSEEIAVKSQTGRLKKI